ncbi:MAG TPA: hypothetical protein EYP32_05965 [Aquificaceae bacterium]|nr:hypothetical protein [Aquificaceae bacterium]
MKMLLVLLIFLNFSLGFGNCFVEAGFYYKVNPYILFAIAKVESNLNPYAIEVISNKKLPINCSKRRKNGKYYYSCFPKSKDEALKILKLAQKEGANYSLGLGQINKIWIERYKLNAEKLFDACYNVYWSAYILNRCYKFFGNSWKTIDCYNKGLLASSESEYVLKIYKELSSLWKE